nr:MFS transporter [Wenjunlia vitaminophila]
MLGTLGLLTVLLGAALSILDFFIVNVALSTIESDLHADGATLEMIVAGYGITYAVLLVVGGRLGDTYGRRTLFLIGVSTFGVTSLACGVAPGVVTLVAARMAQGASAALMVPQVLATIHAACAGERRARALSLYGAMAGLSTIVGQVLGGVLVEADVAGTGWRSIFLVNVPVVLVVLVLALRTVPDTRAEQPAGIDVPGTVLLASSLLALLVPLTQGRATGWPVWSWVLLAALPALLAGFVAVERRAERSGRVPLVPPSLLAVPAVRSGLGTALPLFAGFGGFMFVMAVVLQQGLGLDPVVAGATMVPTAAAFFFASLVAPRWIVAHGRRVLTGGAALLASGVAVLLGTVALGWPDLEPWYLVPGMTLFGFGQGLVMTPLFRVVLAEVPGDRAGVGSGVLITAQQSSLALGVATLGSLFAELSSDGGMGDAWRTVLAVQFAVCLATVWLTTRLPRRVA